MRFFDTAPLYGNGLAEERLGIALRGVPRDSYVLNTKVGILSGGVTGGFDYDFSASGVERCFERSLRRLGTERIDILHLHEPEGFADQVLQETLPLVAGWREQGLIGALSAGVNHWSMVEPFVEHLDCVLLAGRCTLLEQGALPFLERQRQEGRPVLGAGIFNSGILATGPRDDARYNYVPAPPAVRERVDRPAAGVRTARSGDGARGGAVRGRAAGHRFAALRRLQPRRAGSGARRHARSPSRGVVGRAANGRAARSRCSGARGRPLRAVSSPSVCCRANAVQETKGAENVFHHQHQMQFVRRRRLELWDQVTVEVAGLRSLGVYQQAAAADLPTDRGRTGDHVLQQTGAQPTAFVADAHPQSSQQRDRLGVAPRSLAQPRWRGVHGNAGQAPGVVGDHLGTACRRDHEDLSRAGRSRLAGVAPQPQRLLQGTALEPLQSMVAGQQRG